MKLNKKISDSLNTMYQDIVNKKVNPDVKEPKYIEAKNYIESNYPRLNNSVMEYLALYMCVYPSGKIEFYPAKGSAVNLLCTYADQLKLICYNGDGIMIREEISTNVQPQQG